MDPYLKNDLLRAVLSLREAIAMDRNRAIYRPKP
jgi:hypothetical protein